jgi:hypothetical protein
MTVYSDGTHLMASTKEELHRFARRIGLRRPWFQDHATHPHYDLTSVLMANKAARAGAVVVSSREMLDALEERP